MPRERVDVDELEGVAQVRAAVDIGMDVVMYRSFMVVLRWSMWCRATGARRYGRAPAPRGPCADMRSAQIKPPVGSASCGRVVEASCRKYRHVGAKIGNGFFSAPPRPGRRTFRKRRRLH